MFDRESFESEKRGHIDAARRDARLIDKGREFLIHADKYNYGYFWRFMDIPIIQMPADIVLTQEILWDRKPTIVIEAGVAWGGSLVMYAAFQELYGKGQVIGIDTTIPSHNRKAIMNTPVSNRITLIEGSSTDPKIFESIKMRLETSDTILLVLDSNHSEDHVFNELKLWSQVLKKGDFLIVSDTIVEDIPYQIHRPRSWGPGNNPGTALAKFLQEETRFTADNQYSHRAMSSFNPGGYLECIR